MQSFAVNVVVDEQEPAINVDMALDTSAMHALLRGGSTAKRVPRGSQIFGVQHAVAIADKPAVIDRVVFCRFNGGEGLGPKRRHEKRCQEQ